MYRHKIPPRKKRTRIIFHQMKNEGTKSQLSNTAADWVKKKHSYLKMNAIGKDYHVLK